MPVQRIPRYRLLLESLLKFTRKNHPDREQLGLALEKVTETAEWINENINRVQRMKKIIEIEDLVDNLSDVLEGKRLLSTPDRAFVSEHKFCITRNGHLKNSICYIFSDGLLITVESDKSGRYEAIVFAPLHTSYLRKPVPSLKDEEVRIEIDLDKVFANTTEERNEPKEKKEPQNSGRKVAWWFQYVTPACTYRFQAPTEAAKFVFKHSFRKTLDEILASSPLKRVERLSYQVLADEHLGEWQAIKKPIAFGPRISSKGEWEAETEEYTCRELEKLLREHRPELEKRSVLPPKKNATNPKSMFRGIKDAMAKFSPLKPSRRARGKTVESIGEDTTFLVNKENSTNQAEFLSREIMRLSIKGKSRAISSKPKRKFRVTPLPHTLEIQTKNVK